jgi:predicted N-formylglutamate amidohydrolase
VSGERAAFERAGTDAPPHLIFVCDHASNAIPPEFGSLGLSPDLFARHIAYDIGAADVTRAMATAFNAPALLGVYSRLLIDLNRGADDPTLVMKLSDGAIIPGNAKADATEIRTRIARLAKPLLDELNKASDLVIGDNEPYSGELEGDCMSQHALAHGLIHVLIEIRQDLIADQPGAAHWAARLTPLLRASLARLDSAQQGAKP